MNAYTPSVELDDRKSKLKALAISTGITGLLLFGIWMWTVTVPNPPFPDALTPEQEPITLDIGILNEPGGGYETLGGGSEQGDGGQVQESGGQPNPSSPTQSNAGGAITEDNDASVSGSNNPSPNLSSMPAPSKELADAIKNLGAGGTTTTPNNNNGTGDPYSSGGTGGGKGDGVGPGPGPGTGGPVGTGSGPGYYLKGREFVSKPSLVNTTQEEGIVAIEIVVNREGIVTKATPLSLGSTTTDSRLRALARQAALKWRFSPSKDAEEEQIGKIFFKFDLK